MMNRIEKKFLLRNISDIRNELIEYRKDAIMGMKCLSKNIEKDITQLSVSIEAGFNLLKDMLDDLYTDITSVKTE